MGHCASWKLPSYPLESEGDCAARRDLWAELHSVWRKAYNTCDECGSDKLTLSNADAIWGDGDYHCENGHFVRYRNSS